MVGPFVSSDDVQQNSSSNKYYCSGKEYGYCDRRSGTCFCNHGYTGKSCEKCVENTHIRVGSLCYEKKQCPNDCMGSRDPIDPLGESTNSITRSEGRGGTCDYITGKCQCFPFRTGDDCSIQICSKLFHPFCTSCNQTTCLECKQGYTPVVSVSFAEEENDEGSSVVSCKPCSKLFDPRCLACNQNECLSCIDLLLTSIRRAGDIASHSSSSSEHAFSPLPQDETERELSMKLPFGTLSPESFDEAEPYYNIAHIDTEYNKLPLKDHAVVCHQGLNYDNTFDCTTKDVNISHVICGNYGTFSFDSPEYQVFEGGDGSSITSHNYDTSSSISAEHGNFIRITVKRSGGGYGYAHVSYKLKHLTTTDSHISPNVFYNNNLDEQKQHGLLIFQPGEISKSFLITIHDDRHVVMMGTKKKGERQRAFQLELIEPSKKSSLGPQAKTIVTILDDDTNKTCCKYSQITSTIPDNVANTKEVIAGQPFSFFIHARTCTNDTQLIGGDVFLGELKKQEQHSFSSITKETTIHHTNHYQNHPYLFLQNENITDYGNGTYELQICIEKAGKYQLYLYQLIRGGLLGTYHSDSFFFKKEKQRVDAVLNFTSSLSNEKRNEQETKSSHTSTTTATASSSYISVKWEGFIKATHSENYFISIVHHHEQQQQQKFNSGSGVKLWLDYVLYIDTFPSSSSSSTIENTIENYYMDANHYIFVQIEYIRQKNYNNNMKKGVIPMLQLFWQSENTPHQIIPSYALYYKEQQEKGKIQEIYEHHHYEYLRSVIHVYPSKMLPSASHSKAYGIGLFEGYAGEKTHISIALHDAYGNFITMDNNDPFLNHHESLFHIVCSIRKKKKDEVQSYYYYDDENPITASTSNNDITGMYDSIYIARKSGEYRCNVTLNEEEYHKHIFGSPFIVDILPGRMTFASESLVFSSKSSNASPGDGDDCVRSSFNSMSVSTIAKQCSSIKYGMAGVEQYFFIESRDMNRNTRRLSSGKEQDLWLVTLNSLEDHSSSSSYQYGRVIPMNDESENKEGPTHIVFITPKSSGQNILSVMLNNNGLEHAKGSPFHFHVYHNQAYGPLSLVVSTSSTNNTASNDENNKNMVFTANTANHIDIQTVDRFSNHLESNTFPTGTATNVTFSLESIEGSKVTTVEQDNIVEIGNGILRIYFTPVNSSKNCNNQSESDDGNECNHHIISIKINNEHIKGSPFSYVQVVPGLLGNSTSTAEEEENEQQGGLTHSIAGKIGSFIIQSRDSSGNPLINIENITFIARLDLIEHSPKPQGAVQQEQNNTTSFYGVQSYVGNGKFLIQYNVTISGLYQMHVYSTSSNSSSPIVGSPFAVTVSPSDIIDPILTDVIGKGTRKGIAGENSLIRIYTRDVFGNYLLKGGTHFMVVYRMLQRKEQEQQSNNDQLIVFSRHQQDWEIVDYNNNKKEKEKNATSISIPIESEVDLVDKGNGQYTANFIPQFSGEYELEITMDKKGGLFASYYNVPDDVQQQQTNHYSSQHHLLFDRIDAEINKIWSYDLINHRKGEYQEDGYFVNPNHVLNNTSISSRDSSNYHTPHSQKVPRSNFRVEWRGKLKADYSEEYIISVKCDENAKVSVTIDQTDIIEFGPCCCDKSSSSRPSFSSSSSPKLQQGRNGYVILSADKYVDIYILYKNHHFDSTRGVTKSNDEIPFIHLMWSSSTSTSSSFVTIPEKNLFHQVLVRKSALITDESDEDSIIQNNNMNVPIISVEPNPKVIPSHSTATGEALHYAIAGFNHSFLVECRDGYARASASDSGSGTILWGNLLLKGVGSNNNNGIPLLIHSFARKRNNESVRINTNVTDNYNGTFTIHYYPKMSGSYILSVAVFDVDDDDNSIDNKLAHSDLGLYTEDTSIFPNHIFGSPFLLKVYPGPTSFLTSHLIHPESPSNLNDLFSSSTVTGGYGNVTIIQAEAGVRTQLVIQSKDKEGNMRDSGKDKYFAYIAMSKDTLSAEEARDFFLGSNSTISSTNKSSGSTSRSNDILECHIEDNNNGKYLLSFVPSYPLATGHHFLHIFLLSSPTTEEEEEEEMLSEIFGSPYLINIRAGPASSSQTRIYSGAKLKITPEKTNAKLLEEDKPSSTVVDSSSDFIEKDGKLIGLKVDENVRMQRKWSFEHKAGHTKQFEVRRRNLLEISISFFILHYEAYN